MAVKWILFDLDGTLLPMDQEDFIKAYFGGLSAKMVPHGYEPEALIKAVWKGTGAMIKNDGSVTNDKVFWDSFVETFGEGVFSDIEKFDEYYVTDFDNVKNVCGYNEKAGKTVNALSDMGFKLALATNPLFPPIATEKRIKWAGLDRGKFELVTNYENSSYCKPNLDYYHEILDKLDAKPEECLMVGNDVGEDMVAKELGMKVFLLTDCIINKKNEDISKYPNGSFDELLKYAKKLKRNPIRKWRIFG